MNVVIYKDGTDLLTDRLNISQELFFEKVMDLFESGLTRNYNFSNEVEKIEISAVFIPPEKMAELNGHYRGIGQPTDILSFPLWEESLKFQPPEGWAALPLGDMCICPDIVADNAAQNGKGFAEELVLVLSHGLLHLIGYDHDTEERERIMWTEQERMVRSFFEPDEGDGR